MEFSPEPCLRILGVIYDLARANSRIQVNSHAIVGTTGLNTQTISECLHYLESKNYVRLIQYKPTNLDLELVSITAEGIEFIELQRAGANLAQNPQSSGDAPQIFISYAREDATHALKVYEELGKEGYKPWLDTESILPGEDWEITVSIEMRNSRFFIALVSKNSVARGYAQKELKSALEILEEFPENDVFIIPARLEPVEILDSRLRRIQYVDLFLDWQKGFNKILDVMKKYSAS